MGTITGATASRTVKLGDDFEVVVERPNGLKASRAFAIMRSVSDRLPEIAERWGTYQREYGESHSVELDRGYAMLKWGPQPLVRDGTVVTYPATDEHGNQHPRAGEVVMVPSPLTAISEEGWAARGQKMTMPADPPLMELVAVVFDKAIEVAEQHVYRLIALMTLSNDTVNARWRTQEGELDKAIDERVDELLTRSYGDELIELAVVCSEVVDESFVGKARRLVTEGRASILLRAVGLSRPSRATAQTDSEAPQTSLSTDEPSASSPETTSPPSSTDSPASTDGPGETPSTHPTTSSSPSPSGSTVGAGMSRSD